MIKREKIAHLMRRFAYGATPNELDDLEKLGVEGTLEHLLNAPYLDKASPYEFFWREKEEADLASWRIRVWWFYQLVTTPVPLREKMAIFWHSHFAVSDGKVEDGPMMLDYLQVIRRGALGKFSDLLSSVSRNPAMMKYLDMERSIRGRPNENFAREVMELYTLGIGNYTETDVRELARAFTGRGYVNTFWEWPGDSSQKLKDAMADRRGFSFFTELPTARDDGNKTILGQTGDFDGERALRLLAEHPATADFIVRKLWEYLAYPAPEPEVVSRLASTFQRSKGNITTVLRAIATTEEFWSPRCVRQRVKDPADYVVSIARAMNLGREVERIRGNDAKPETRLPDKAWDELVGPVDRMERAGMSLLWPPDPSGWKWGEAWLNPDMMLERLKFNGVMIWGEDDAGPGAKAVLMFVRSRPHATAVQVAASLCEYFDVDLPDEKLMLLAEVIAKDSGLESVDHPGWWSGVFNRAMTVLVAAPEMHLC